MNKILILLCMCLLLVGSISYIYYDSNSNIKEDKNNMEKQYQGPVPVGYDVEHFRKTGETIKEVSD